MITCELHPTAAKKIVKESNIAIIFPHSTMHCYIWQHALTQLHDAAACKCHQQLANEIYRTEVFPFVSVCLFMQSATCLSLVLSIDKHRRNCPVQNARRTQLCPEKRACAAPLFSLLLFFFSSLSHEILFWRVCACGCLTPSTPGHTARNRFLLHCVGPSFSSPNTTHIFFIIFIHI